MDWLTFLMTRFPPNRLTNSSGVATVTLLLPTSKEGILSTVYALFMHEVFKNIVDVSQVM